MASKSVSSTSTSELSRESKYYQTDNGAKIISDKVYEDILKLQSSTKLIISKCAFHRLVYEILQKYDPAMRIGRFALEALQEAVEMYLVQYFEDSQECASHANRCTLMSRDMVLIKKLQRQQHE